MDIDVERAQIAVVHADNARARIDCNRELGGVVHFDQHVEAERHRMVVQDLQLHRSERGDDQQHRVGARGARFVQLIFGHDEVFAQKRQRHRGANRGQMIERSVEERGFRQDRNRRRPPIRVALRDCARIVARAQHTARRRATLALGDDLHRVLRRQCRFEPAGLDGHRGCALREPIERLRGLAHLDDPPSRGDDCRQQVRPSGRPRHAPAPAAEDSADEIATSRSSVRFAAP